METFTKLGWKETVRGEQLTLEQFAQLSDALTERHRASC